MKKRFLFFPLALICVCAAAQDRSAYLIPRTVYVGDKAVLSLPLPARESSGDITLEGMDADFFSSEEIDIHRVALENRPQGRRLVVEFSAYVPGQLELPPIEIGGERFAGITVNISSALSGSDAAVLSGILPPAAVPGTAFLVYGTMVGIVLVLLFALWIALRGRKLFSGWLSAWERRRLIVSMMRIEKRLRKNLRGGIAEQNILDTLSGEFRSFLSLFTGENCRAKTAGEFGRLVFFQEFPGMPPEWDSRFLESFFRRCDNLRFSGGAIDSADIMALLAELRQFLAALAKAGRERKEA